ncbi:hypothetical protein [Vulcanisaeta sp. JCM 14467]|uniref:hypothetical protein n=1 Tax=Vulcanisaeta sp. JCM 14467 TaxID=1295370 RepID=UPI0006D19688|nr:hypothetical protein [Vulcanisaeta sp. JCM 14467]
MQWLQNNAPRTKVRAFLILNSTYPYLVSGTLYGINYTVVGKAMVLIEYPVTNFTAFTDSETPVNALGIPSISNVTFLWLSINPGHGCLLLTYIDNKSATEPCDSPQYLNSNATYAEVIYFGNPPFSVITATINNTVVYTGAWKWLSPPTQSTVETSNNTVTINFTISIPPEHCINITNPRTGLNETICYPGTTSALLWYFASNAQVQLPSKVGNSTTCQYTVLNTTLYREVNIGSEEDELKALINKLNEEITIGRNITGVGKNLTLKLPSPAPTGYEQKEIEITCTNYANKTVVVPGSITITGNIGNPWYAKVPLGLTPSISWVINSIVVGSQELLSGWSYFRKLFFAVGGFVPRWLAESVMIFGLLDGAMWIAGFPTPMAPAWAVMNNVIYDLSLVLYLRIGGMGRILNRITRRVRKAVGSRTRAIQERVGHWVSRHRRVARLVNPITKAFHDTKAFVGREIVPRLTPLRILTSPLSTGLRVAKELAEDKALTYEQEGRVWRTRLARAGAVLAKAAVEYPRARELGMRGRLYEVTGMKLLSEEGKKELLSALRSRDFRRAYRALRMTTEMDRRFLYEELSTKTLDRDMHVYEARRGDIKRVNKGELLTDLMNAIIMAPLASVGTYTQHSSRPGGSG